MTDEIATLLRCNRTLDLEGARDLAHVLRPNEAPAVLDDMADNLLAEQYRLRAVARRRRRV